MVKLQLTIAADLENITSLVPADDDFEYFFKVKCNSCHEVHPKFVALNPKVQYEVGTGKGNTANFVWRCGMCKRESSAKFESNRQPYTAENGHSARLLVIECRGLEFVDFDPRGKWRCVGLGEKGTVFEDVQIPEGEWYDYDEKGGVPVSVSGFKSEWSRA